MKATGVILIFGLLSRAFTAPVDINVDKKGGPRVSTKEILNLEQQLKAQAGEDKKFYPSEMKSKHVPPQQQVDGLEDSPKDGPQPGNPVAESPALPAAEAGEETGPQSPQFPEYKQLAPVPDQLDLAQLDELEAAAAAEKRQAEAGQQQEEENLIDEDDVDVFQGPSNPYAGSLEAEAAANNRVDAQQLEEEREQEREQEQGEMKGQREDDEALFMQSVIEALRDRPELLQQFLQGRLDEDIPEDTRVPVDEDNADRADVIRAEYLEAMGERGRHWDQQGGYIPSEVLQSEQLLKPMQVEDIRELENGSPDEQENQLAQQRYTAMENYQQYKGDKAARVVKKSYQLYGGHDDSSEEKSDSSSDSSDSKSESKSDEYKKSSESDSSEEDEDRNEKEFRKRVDLSQHLAM